VFRTLKPEKVFVTEDVYADPDAARTVERMMTSIEAPLEKVSYEELDRIAADRWQHLPRWGAMENPRDPDMILTTAKFHSQQQREEWAAHYPNLMQRDLIGYRSHQLRGDGTFSFRRERRGIICHSARELRSAVGCPFRCAYCSFGTVIRVLVNMEEYVRHLDEIVNLEPRQRLYKWDNQTDVNCFEPEWGATRRLVEYFATRADKYLEIYTGKSDNVDYMLGLNHGGRTIIQWSLGARTQSTVFEKETAAWDQRIEAARKCQEAGYIVRFRFSPIIPVRNWREENAEMISRIFERTKPDVISLCAFGWMSLEDAKACLDFDLLDPDYVRAMEGEAPFLAFRGYTSGGGHPIPHDARAAMFKFLIDEIRKHNRTIPVSLCLETVEMWALFQDELGMPMDPNKASSYYCNCGPMCTPEHPYAKGITPGRSWFGEG